MCYHHNQQVLGFEYAGLSLVCFLGENGVVEPLYIKGTVVLKTVIEADL